MRQLKKKRVQPACCFEPIHVSVGQVRYVGGKGRETVCTAVCHNVFFGQNSDGNTPTQIHAVYVCESSPCSDRRSCCSNMLSQ